MSCWLGCLTLTDEMYPTIWWQTLIEVLSQIRWLVLIGWWLMTVDEVWQTGNFLDLLTVWSRMKTARKRHIERLLSEFFKICQSDISHELTDETTNLDTLRLLIISSYVFDGDIHTTFWNPLCVLQIIFFMKCVLLFLCSPNACWSQLIVSFYSYRHQM